MFKSNKFGRIFWVDDELEFKSCPLNVDETGDFNCEDYVSVWTDWEVVNMEILFNIYRCELINKVEYGYAEVRYGNCMLGSYTLGQ